MRNHDVLDVLRLTCSPNAGILDHAAQNALDGLAKMRLEEDISHQISLILQYLAHVLELSVRLEFNELEAVRSDHKHIQSRHGPLESAGIFSAESSTLDLD